jgi:hypothetical protein
MMLDHVQVASLFDDLAQKYRGPGSADPKKTREARAAELRSMLRSEDGLLVVRRLYHEVKDIPMGTLRRATTRVGEMTDEILAHEYPTG